MLGTREEPISYAGTLAACIQAGAPESYVKKTYCVFNKARESFLSLNVTMANTHLSRLRGLLGKFRLKADEGVWVVPSRGIHTIGVLFAIDLLYLDSEHRVIHMVESFGSFGIAPLRTKSVSVLELPTRTISSSQTQVGDQLLICTPAEMEQYLRKDRKQAAANVSSA
jgi:uncharacterized membrane protein (UPF0127 family)